MRIADLYMQKLYRKNEDNISEVSRLKDNLKRINTVMQPNKY